MRTRLLILGAALLTFSPDRPAGGPAADPLPIDVRRLAAGRDSFAILVQGAQLGFSAFGVEVVGNGRRLTEHSSIAGLVEQTTTIEIGPDGAVRSVRQAGKNQGEPTSIELEYAGGRVRGTATTVGADGPKTVQIDTTVAAGTLDDNAVQGLLPALPWAPGARWTFPVFSGGQNESKLTTLAVAATETVTLPSGPVEAYRVEWTDGWQPATFWITTAEPHRVVRLAVANAPVEIVRVR